MIAVPLVHTQLVPPHIKNCIKRSSLEKQGFSILSHRVTTVTAPAGYGKSVWISSLLEDPRWPPTAWLSLDIHDSEPSFLLYHLIHAIKNSIPGSDGQSLRTINSLEDVGRDWRIAVASLIEEIPYNRDFVLVLDDFYLIDANRVVCEILEYLIHWLPPRAHLILISRNIPTINLNLYRERLSGELLEITSEDLRFSIKETSELLILLGLNLTDTDIEFIYTRTEGWAAVIRLLGMLLKQGGNFEKALTVLKAKDAELYIYLNNELLNSLPGELYDFMLDSSLLPYLEPELCNAALQRSDSNNIINQLHSQGILSKIEGAKVTWRFHRLMEEFLENRAALLRPPEYIVLIRQRAASFLQDKGDIDRALEQLAACPDWSAAANIIRDHSDEHFLHSGRLDALHSWISRFPENIINDSQWLLYFQGRSILHTCQEEALYTLSSAADLAARQGDIECQVRSLLAMFMVYAFANNVKKIKETARRIPLAASTSKSSWSDGIVLVGELGRAAWEDNLKQGERLSWLAGKAKLDPEFRMSYLVFSFIIQYRLGNLSAARKLIEKLFTDNYVRENEFLIGEIDIIYAFFCMLTGNHNKLAEICSELLHLGQKYNAPHQLGFAHRGRAHIYLREGRYDEARNEFGLSHDDFIQANNIFYAYLTDLDLILLRMQAGENSGNLLAETQCILDRLNSDPGGMGLDDYALSAAGIIAMEAGQLELARERFEEVSRRSRCNGARHVLAGTQLFLARLHLMQDNEAAADSCLSEALSAAETEKWEYFWNWHEDTMYAMCRHALLKGIHPTWAARILSRWFPERTCKEAGNLLLYPDEGVRSSIISIITNMVQKSGVPVIHVNCLGGFQVFVNGLEVNPGQWKTKKAVNLFKYLLIEKGKNPKEKIIEALWPGTEPHRGDASLRMALTHVRRALNLNNTEIIILRRGIIYLNPQIQLYTDYELFTAIARNSSADICPAHPALVDSLEQAVQLYRGEFLPDNIYDDWTAGLREQIRQLYLQVLLKLVQFYRRQDKQSSVIQTCRRYLALEPADESVCRTAMEMLWLAGQKQQALSLYRDLADFMSREYNAAPAHETSSLFKKIRSS